VDLAARWQHEGARLVGAVGPQGAVDLVGNRARDRLRGVLRIHAPREGEALDGHVDVVGGRALADRRGAPVGARGAGPCGSAHVGLLPTVGHARATARSSCRPRMTARPRRRGAAGPGRAGATGARRALAGGPAATLAGRSGNVTRGRAAAGENQKEEGQ